MAAVPHDPRLAEWAAQLERVEWAAVICDSQWRLAWVSPELKQFLRATDDDDLGVGEHLAEAFLRDTWLRSVHPDSQVAMFLELAPYFVHDLTQRGIAGSVPLPEQFVPLLQNLEPQEPPQVRALGFDYTDPGADEELSAYRVNLCVFRLNDTNGDLVGAVGLFFMGVRPNLLALLGRGNHEMYERMARLVEPSPHQAAILFCDLHASGRLSRSLASVAYFKLIRRLWTAIDAVVADNHGIIGKHAGDGASAFFLVDDLGSACDAAAAALRTAARIHELSGDIFDGLLGGDAPMKIGVHWGGTLYMGQLVPGGRLDVTALGDEVNETARLQEAAGPGETVASKDLLEQLDPEKAADLGLDLEKLTYGLLAELPNVDEKAVRDAGAIPVTKLAADTGLA